jgi:ferrous iron transport protein A
MRTLEMLTPGILARIEAIQSDCDRAGRLSSLGFIPGQWVKVIRLAPLGDPLTVEFDGQEISLRRSEARLITLEPAGGAG